MNTVKRLLALVFVLGIILLVALLVLQRQPDLIFATAPPEPPPPPPPPVVVLPPPQEKTIHSVPDIPRSTEPRHGNDAIRAPFGLGISGQPYSPESLALQFKESPAAARDRYLGARLRLEGDLIQVGVKKADFVGTSVRCHFEEKTAIPANGIVEGTVLGLDGDKVLLVDCQVIC